MLEEDDQRVPEAGIGFCLSGGGYRAMLFHVGAILRLNEAKLLSQLDRISSVSGGSITAGVLGMNWNKLDFQPNTPNAGIATNLNELFVKPIRKLASETIDRMSIVGGLLVPGLSISDIIVNEYRRVLFGDATLQNLPSDDKGPRFVINATNVQTASLVRFSRPYFADYKVGRVIDPEIPLAVAVAASSAFPPVLSPLTLDINPSDFEVDVKCPLQYVPFTDTMVLSDGGVYDNLGLETVIKRYQTVLVSDAGGKIDPEPSPAANWAEHSKRILDIIDDQVRNLRKRSLISDYVAKRCTGTYWGIRTNIADYGISGTLPAPHAKTMVLAATPTRLKALPTSMQNQLMNWGYAVCDAALRTHMTDILPPGFAAPTQFPFPDGV
ncbi:MAG: patatin-like phospholipase family protein [Planctomycetaceae bacterium]